MLLIIRLLNVVELQQMKERTKHLRGLLTIIVVVFLFLLAWLVRELATGQFLSEQ